MDDLIAILAVVATLIGLVAKSSKKNAKGQPARAKAQSAAGSAASPAPAAAPPAMQGELPHMPAPHVHELKPQVAVTPHTPDIFSGSMNASTGEGFDPCHEAELTPQSEPCMASPRPVPPQVSPAPLQLSWTGNDMVKAVVMQEILQRPCDRQRR